MEYAAQPQSPGLVRSLLIGGALGLGFFPAVRLLCMLAVAL
jgi:hypothetical protein